MSTWKSRPFDGRKKDKKKLKAAEWGEPQKTLYNLSASFEPAFLL